MLDVGNTHAVYNNSNVDRYHIVHEQEPRIEELVIRSYEKNGTK